MEDFRDKGIRTVILCALPGTKTWSAGHNVGELPKQARDPLTCNDPLRVVVRKIQEYPAPVLAMVEGGVWGARVNWQRLEQTIKHIADEAVDSFTPAPTNVSPMISTTVV